MRKRRTKRARTANEQVWRRFQLLFNSLDNCRRDFYAATFAVRNMHPKLVRAMEVEVTALEVRAKMYWTICQQDADYREPHAELVALFAEAHDQMLLNAGALWGLSMVDQFISDVGDWRALPGERSA